MDIDDRRRYFVVGSVIYEIVTPLFRQRLENDFKNRGFASLQTFADSQPIIHILFHLRHTNVCCCQDKQNCKSRASLPLNYNQWDLLFTQVNPAIRNHLCHCQYTANPVQLDDLDLTLAGLILLNCCNLAPAEEIAIKGLRKFKNNYLSHNTKGNITETEYNIVWQELIRLVLQLDNTKHDDLIRIENRPLDEPLCMKYCIEMLDVHKKLEEMNECIQQNSVLLQGIKASQDTSVQGNSVLLQEINNKLQELLQRGDSYQCYNKPGESTLPVKPYKLGQSIFKLHHQFDLRSLHNVEWITGVSDIVMMDDGRIVLCLHNKCRLLICNTDGSQTDSIPLQDLPTYVTAVNNSTVAVLSVGGDFYIDIYDINKKNKLKSILQPEWPLGGITTINNKLVVDGRRELYIIDHQTGEVVQSIRKEAKSNRLFFYSSLHASGNRIFYRDCDTNQLYCYSYTDDVSSVTSLTSEVLSITSLQDGSLYVVRDDGSVQHVSADGKHYRTVATKGLKSVGNCKVICYNQKQRKLVSCSVDGSVNVFTET